MGSEAKHSVSTPRNGVRVLPVVVKICQRVDEIFVRYVGPIGPELAQEGFHKWARQNRARPTEIVRYIHLLSQNIYDEEQRVLFFEEARESVRAQITRFV